MKATTFEQFAGVCAVLAGAGGFLYSVSFILLKSDLLSALFLMVGGLLSTAVLVAVYGRLRETDAGFALWALLLSLGGAAGSAIHGGYDLANTLHPPGTLPAGLYNLPSQADPRGLLTFGLTGIALFVVAWVMRRGGQFPKGLSYLAYLFGVLVVLLYLGRLIILEATSPMIVVPAVLAGFLVSPAWYIWLGLALWRGRRV